MTNLQQITSDETGHKTQFVLVSQYAANEEPNFDLADVAVAAWKNRKILLVSWIILGIATYITTNFTNKIAVSTFLQSGRINTDIQTTDEIRDQIANDLYPRCTLAIEKESGSPRSTALKVASSKGSNMVEVTVATSSNESEAISLLSDVTQSWLNNQKTKLQRQAAQTKERMALLRSQIASSLPYIASLGTPSDPLQQAEANRVRLQTESDKLALFNLTNPLANIEEPFIRIPFDSTPPRLSGIQGVAFSVVGGGFLAIGVAYLAGIVRTAKRRLQSS